MKTFNQAACHSTARRCRPLGRPVRHVSLWTLTALWLSACGVDEQLAEVSAAAEAQIAAASRGSDPAGTQAAAASETGVYTTDAAVAEGAVLAPPAESDAATPAAALPATDADVAEQTDADGLADAGAALQEEREEEAATGTSAPTTPTTPSTPSTPITPTAQTSATVQTAAIVAATSDRETSTDSSAPTKESSVERKAPEDELDRQTDEASPERLSKLVSDPAPESPSAGESDATLDTPSTLFESTATPGFSGEMLRDGSLRLRWPVDGSARGYNVYRDSAYYITVFDNEFVDRDIVDKDYYFEIHAFDYQDRFSVIATGLTVQVRGTGRPDPQASRYKRMDLSDYELVFADEFNGYELDTSKWNTRFLWGPDLIINSELQYYVDTTRMPNFGYQPFVFDGESISIRAQRTPEKLRAAANGQAYLSGILTSYDAFKFTYGYAEMRARLPFGRGFWPAFWLLNAYYVGAKPEIDIMEFIGSDRDVVYHTYHYYDENGALRSTHSQPTTGIDFTNGYHTYAVEWRPGLLIYYVDGIERHRIADANVSSQQMYVIANLAVGGWWAGAPDSSTPFPAEYKIDYIRVYQKAGQYAEMPYYDGVPRIPLASRSKNRLSSGHRPTARDWPEGYPEGM